MPPQAQQAEASELSGSPSTLPTSGSQAGPSAPDSDARLAFSGRKQAGSRQDSDSDVQSVGLEEVTVSPGGLEIGPLGIPIGMTQTEFDQIVARDGRVT